MPVLHSKPGPPSCWPRNLASCYTWTRGPRGPCFFALLTPSRILGENIDAGDVPVIQKESEKIMSCFIVNDYHLRALVTWAELRRVALPYSAPVSCELLAVANRRAFAERYQGRYQDEVPTFGGYQVAALGELLPVDIVKACDCLDYQACDWSGWDASEAAAVLREIRAAAVAVAAAMLRLPGNPEGRELPGYDAAAWELADPAELADEVQA